MFCSLFLLGSIQYITILSPRILANVMEVSRRVFELCYAWMDDGSDKIVSADKGSNQFQFYAYLKLF